jgi:3-deoxy-D-manno-octulosonic acid kinase
LYRADLLTEALPAARTLSDTITGATLQEEAWKRIGATIANFHRAGVQHADLNAHNILLAEGGNVFVLDFDRGRIRERGAWEQRVLARLRRSLLKIQRQRGNVSFNRRDWAALTEGVKSCETR